MTEERKQEILKSLRLKYNFDEKGLFGVQPLQNYIKKNNYTLMRDLESLKIGSFRYLRNGSETFLYYKAWRCNSGMLFANIKRSDLSKYLMRRIMEYLNTFNGIASWKGFIETAKILDKDYIDRHPNALFRWAEKSEIDDLVDAVWDMVYEKLDKAAFYIKEADEYIESRREKERSL